MATLTTKYYNDTTHVVYNLDGDPTVFAWGNVNASNNSFLYRSDNGTLYMKTGPLSTDWTLVGAGAGGGAVTDGGEAGILGAGTALDPSIPVAGPFRPIDQVYAFDDYLVGYPPNQVGFLGSPDLQGVGNTSVLQNDIAGTTTVWDINGAAGALGPVGMMGVMALQLNGAANGKFLSATQFRPGDDSGNAIDQSLLLGEWDLWWAARVSYEGVNNFEGSQKSWAGFYAQFDDPNFNAANKEGAYFHPKDNGGQVNWFARYRIADDTGIVEADVDTGVRVGFTVDHPATVRAPQNLLVRFKKTGANVALNMYIDGVLVVGPIALVNPASRFLPMVAIESTAAAQFNTMYTDWMMWSLKGRSN